MTDAEAEFDYGPLDAATLELLVQLDEALRSGTDLSESLPCTDGLIKKQLASAALCLFELEAAFPRAPQPPIHSFNTVQLPKQIGRFEIDSQIGSGGFGVVYRGRDPELNRLVAIKVPRHHTFAEREVRRRFVREAHAAAQLDHPHIVPIYEAGERENLPYIAFAYCDGPTLARFCADQQLMAPRVAANLLLKLVQAVAYSHSRGILHRDIKPSNILLFPSENGTEAFPFTPKLADLGLAKLVEPELDETATFQLLGTPTFMSPEQAQGKVVGPTSDIYSLGATLYFMLAGRPPFVAAQLADLLKQLVEREAVDPKALNVAVDNDLNTICMKCLDKNPSRRYTDATSMANDLQRYLSGLPISARPISKLVRLKRWCQRNPAVALLTACICLLTVGLLGTLLHMLAERGSSLRFAQTQQKLARDSERKALQLLYVTDVQAAGEAWNKRDFGSAARLLNAHKETASLQEFGGRYLNHQLSALRSVKLNLGAQIWNIAESHSGNTLAISDAKGFIHLVENSEQLTVKRSWDTGQHEVNHAIYSPDDQILVTAGDDGRIGLWNTESGQLLQMLEAYEQKPVFGIAFADDGRKLIACGNTPDLLVWDLETRQLLLRKTTAHTLGIESLCISPDRRYVATVGKDGALRVHTIDSLQLVLEKSVDAKLNLVRYEPSGQNILAGDKSGRFYIWNATTGADRFTYKTFDPICALTVAPGGDICLTNAGGVLYQINALAYRLPKTETPADPEIRISVLDDKRIAGLAATHDGKWLITGNSKGQLERLPTQTNSERASSGQRINNKLSTHAQSTSQPASFLRVRGSSLERWNLTTCQMQTRWNYECELHACSLTPLGTVILGDPLGNVGQSTINDWGRVAWYKAFEEQPIDQIRMFGQGRYIAALNRSGDLAIIDWPQRKQVAYFENQGFFDISPDHRWLASGKGGADKLEIIDLETFELVVSKPAHSSSIWDVKFSCDGSWLLTCSGDRTAKLWTTHDWNCQSTLVGHAESVRSGCISPDNQTIATADSSGKVIIWYATSAQKLFEVFAPEPGGLQVMFSDDGKLLAIDQQFGDVVTLRGD